MISVVIPAYNAERSIEATLRALSSQAFEAPFEVIVVDDGSTDRTAEIVARHPEVRLIRQPNEGPSVARNRGVAEARGEIVVFTDADCVPTPDFLAQITAPFADPGIAGAKGAYLSKQRELTARFVQIEYEEKYARMAKFDTIDFIDTYAAAFRKADFLAVGGFDPLFRTACVEDQEFSFRMHAAGKKMLFVPQARVFHTHADRVAGYARKKFKIGYFKVIVIRRYPGKIVSDAHTPQTLKAQVLLAGLLPAALLFALHSWVPLGVVGSAFLLSTLPSIPRAWCSDRSVALLLPPFHLLRAFSLGAGLAWGFLSIERSRSSPRWESEGSGPSS